MDVKLGWDCDTVRVIGEGRSHWSCPSCWSFGAVQEAGWARAAEA